MGTCYWPARRESNRTRNQLCNTSLQAAFQAGYEQDTGTIGIWTVGLWLDDFGIFGSPRG